MRDLVGRRSFLIGGLLTLGVPEPVWASERAPAVGLVLLGPSPPKPFVLLATRAVAAVYGFELRVVSRRPLPRRAFRRGAGRYRAEILLEDLATDRTADTPRILGMTATDISTTKPPYPDWGILGLANIGGSAAVVSSARTGRGTRTPAQAAERFGKVVVHELGHSLGLPHCTVTAGCIMEDAHGTVFTTDTERDLCTTCRLRLVALGHPPAGNGPLPW